MSLLENARVAQLSALLPPSIAFQEAPGDMPTYHQVVEARQQILNIISGADDRLLVVLGPPADCEPAALTELATQLQALKPKLEKELCLVVLADAALQPEGPEAVQINRGLRQARELLLQINRLGLPTACEFADTITPQFFADLLSWACVSAGSETLRELVSGLSMPAGLRVPTNADGADELAAAAAGLAAAGEAQVFFGVTSHGIAGIVQSTGNAECGLVMRGGAGTPEQRAKRVVGACAEGYITSYIDGVVGCEVGCRHRM